METPVPSDQPKKKRKLPPLKWVWVGVATLFLANAILLVFSAPESVPPQLGEDLVQETAAFERLSFWERLLQGSGAEEQVLSRFDGLPIDADYEESVVSVMIDNFSLARPQHSGIRSASIVYEALVEGGITRLMLVFPYQETDWVGPVRSARDYFVDFAEEYGGLYAHAGGSPTALDQLWASERLYSIEEDERLEGETYSFRDLEFEAPHNLFFDLLLTRERAEDLDYDLGSPKQSWCFVSDDSPSTFASANALEGSGDRVSRIDIDFSHDPTSSYYVQFQYDPDQQNYRRYYGSGERTPHVDKLDALQVAPTNVVIQFAPSFLIEGDEKERLQLDHIGTGKAFFYRHGEKEVGGWTKVNNDSPTQFLNADGDPMCLLPGQTWIAVVDSEELVLEAL